MADRPAARDEDRLPWLEPFGEGGRARKRKPASRAALVGLLIAFFGVGLAVAFSLGYRFARSPADPPAPSTAPAQPEPTALVRVPLAPPVPLPKVELIAPPLAPLATEAPVAIAPEPVAARPAINKMKSVKPAAKAKKRAKRKPILRPFINIKKRPAVEPAATPAQKPPPAPVPIRAQRTIPFTPQGRIIQLGTYSTERKADAAWRSLTWRYPYLATKPKVLSPTQPIGGNRYYRLRLGTATQAQSVVICQRLLARGQSCIVIY